jgi:hypothetical protein
VHGLGIRRAEVAGQLFPGLISVFRPIDAAPEAIGMPYIVFAGNVDPGGGHPQRTAAGPLTQTAPPFDGQHAPCAADLARARPVPAHYSRPDLGGAASRAVHDAGRPDLGVLRVRRPMACMAAGASFTLDGGWGAR